MASQIRLLLCVGSEGARGQRVRCCSIAEAPIDKPGLCHIEALGRPEVLNDLLGEVEHEHVRVVWKSSVAIHAAGLVVTLSRGEGPFRMLHELFVKAIEGPVQYAVVVKDGADVRVEFLDAAQSLNNHVFSIRSPVENLLPFLDGDERELGHSSQSFFGVRARVVAGVIENHVTGTARARKKKKNKQKMNENRDRSLWLQLNSSSTAA